MTKKRIVGVAALLLLVGPAPAEAQSWFEVEVKPGTAFPIQEIQDESLGTGFGSEGTIAFWVIPDLVVRIGRGPEMPRSLRRPVEEVLV